MAAETLWSCLSAVSTLLIGALFIFRLVGGWRFSRRRSARIFAAVALTAAAAQAAAFYLLDFNQANLAASVVDVAALSMAPALVRWERGRLLFSMAAAYSFTFSTVFISHSLAPEYGPAHLTVQLLAAALLDVFLHRWFAPCLHDAFRIDINGWYGLSLLPVLFGLLFFTLILGVFSGPAEVGMLRPSGLLPGIPDTAISFMLLVLPPCTYIVLYQFFQSLLRQYADCRKHAALSAKVATLESRGDQVRRRNRRELRLAGALRPRLEEIHGLIRRGELDRALALAEALEGQVFKDLERTVRRQYAEDPLLDAVFREYAALAEEAGICYSVEFALPQCAQLDTTSLAVVLSNALENALRACRAQEEGSVRSIRAFTRNTPEQFFLRIENTCGGPVFFDPATGCPVARQEGHGYGTRSIASFVRQCHGALNYGCRDGVFWLQILI